MDLIKPIEKPERRYGRGIREKSPRECIIDFLLEKQDMDWLKEMLMDSGILEEKDRIERIIRDLEKTYSGNPRLRALKKLCRV